MQYNTGLKPYKHSTPYDVDEKVYFSLSYRPRNWTASTEHIKDRDLIIPTTPNGLMYECSSSGISGATEPVFGTVEKGYTIDGSVQWKAVAYGLLLNTGDSITASSWTGTNGESLDNDSIISNIQTKFRLTSVPIGATTATIINHVEVVRANGDVEEFDRSIVIKINVK